jgi:hypothetical protein
VLGALGQRHRQLDARAQLALDGRQPFLGDAACERVDDQSRAHRREHATARPAERLRHDAPL